MSNRQSIEFENQEIKQLNQQLNQEANYQCHVKLVENILFMTTTEVSTTTVGLGMSGDKIKLGSSVDLDWNDDDFLNILQNEDYNHFDSSCSMESCFESDGDQLYLMY